MAFLCVQTCAESQIRRILEKEKSGFLFVLVVVLLFSVSSQGAISGEPKREDKA